MEIAERSEGARWRRTSRRCGDADGQAILAAVRAYRAKMPELLATLPHDLPHQVEDRPPRRSRGCRSRGPKKPDLVRAFRAARL